MNPLYGLVLAGGRSSRMGRDKGLLDYRGKPQREYLCDVLAAHCARVFISIGADQRATAGYDFIGDDPAYETSPMGALLSAHDRHPDAGWFVVSCDLPFFDDACAHVLITARDAAAAGTAFRIAELNQPEPLLTIYENTFVKVLPAAYRAGERSLRRALHRAGARMLDQAAGRCAESVDTLEDYERARRELAEKRAGPRERLRGDDAPA